MSRWSPLTRSSDLTLSSDPSNTEESVSTEGARHQVTVPAVPASTLQTIQDVQPYGPMNRSAWDPKSPESTSHQSSSHHSSSDGHQTRWNRTRRSKTGGLSDYVANPPARLHPPSEDSVGTANFGDRDATRPMDDTCSIYGLYHGIRRAGRRTCDHAITKCSESGIKQRRCPHA